MTPRPTPLPHPGSCRGIGDRLIARMTHRPPDVVIGGEERPYLLRWFVIPRNPVFNVYLHQFLRSDDDRALHDHPWLFNASWLLRGAYVEHTIRAGGILVLTPRSQGAFKFRWGRAPHRLALVPAVGGHEWTCWTLFITGPRVREWGFYCMERGWVHWKCRGIDLPGCCVCARLNPACATVMTMETSCAFFLSRVGR